MENTMKEMTIVPITGQVISETTMGLDVPYIDAEEVFDNENHPNFIESNTQAITFEELTSKNIIPTFGDNTLTISHQSFIGAVTKVAEQVFGELKSVECRVSHPIIGRIPSAQHKKANELRDDEKTIFYQRMAFVAHLKNLTRTINGQTVHLVVGGVRGYNEDKLYNRASAMKFRIFVGWQVRVCSNLCLTCDGYSGIIDCMTEADIMQKSFELFNSFNPNKENTLHLLENLHSTQISEEQFCKIIGTWRENRIADHKAEKEQETDKKKSDLRKEESSQDSAQRIQESKEKTIDAMNLDDHRTNNKIRVIQTQGKEDRATLLLKQNSRNNVASVVDEIDVEPTFPTSTFDVETDDGEEYGDGPLVKRGGVNIFTGIPGTGKTNFANQFGFHQCDMLQSGLFDDGDPSSTMTYYLYDYEMGQGFNKRYSNLVPHNFYRCDMQEKAKNHNDVNVVYSLDYLNKQIKEDLEYPTSDVIMVIDCKGKISNMKGRDVEFITRLQQFIKEYKVKTNHILTFILIEHLNPHMSRSTNFLDVSQIKGSQGYNEFADQTILIGSTGVNGCIRVKVAKNRWGVSQDSTIHLFQRTDKVFFNYIGEYDEKQVLASKNGSNMSLEEFRKTVKPTSTPTFTKKNKSSVAGRPINLTLSTCQAMLNARSQGKSKNEVSRLYGFTRQAYNEALKRYGLVDDYPDGNWKP